MARNVEIKARLSEEKFDSVRTKSIELATGGPLELVQTDTFFETQRGRLKLREFADQTAELIFYERPDCEGPKTSDYVRSSCDPTVKEALDKAYGITGVVEKERTVYFIDQTRVHLDKVAGLGTFLELEVVLKDDESAEFGESVANELMVKLGVDADDLVSGAYFDQINSLTAK